MNAPNLTSFHSKSYGPPYAPTRPDPTRCAEGVWGGGRGMTHSQCARKRGHGPEGAFCKQHDPAAKNARQEAAEARWRAEQARRDLPLRQREAMRDALRAIANGHNDPQALARDTLRDQGLG